MRQSEEKRSVYWIFLQTAKVVKEKLSWVTEPFHLCVRPAVSSCLCDSAWERTVTASVLLWEYIFPFKLFSQSLRTWMELWLCIGSFEHPVTQPANEMTVLATAPLPSTNFFLSYQPRTNFSLRSLENQHKLVVNGVKLWTVWLGNPCG